MSANLGNVFLIKTVGGKFRMKAASWSSILNPTAAITSTPLSNVLAYYNPANVTLSSGTLGSGTSPITSLTNSKGNYLNLAVTGTLYSKVYPTNPALYLMDFTSGGGAAYMLAPDTSGCTGIMFVANWPANNGGNIYAYAPNGPTGDYSCRSFPTSGYGINVEGGANGLIVINGTTYYDGTAGTYPNGTGWNFVGQYAIYYSHFPGVNNTVCIATGWGNRGMKAYVGDFICFNPSHTVSDRQTSEGLLAWKWGLVSSLPVDHPYKNAAPTVSSIV
jgi:hypothetical protein